MSSRSGGPFSFLYNHNPFYLLSSLAVLYGLRLLQQSEGSSLATEPLVLAGALAGFILLLTFIGLLIVRFGGVWEDARSIFLSILLIAFAVSVSLDHQCLVNSQLALAGISLAFGLVALITETLLAVLKIRFPAGWRIPYYLLLALLFFYPLVFSPALAGIHGESSSWLVYGFSFLAAVAMLTLMPAVSRGKAYAEPNGTPWGWPWYPWSIFVVLFVAVGLRSYTLALSFVPATALETSFSTFFLVPPVVAFFALLLQSALVARDRDGQWLVQFWIAPIVVLLTLPLNTSQSSYAFVYELTDTLGSPLWLSVLGLTAFYLLAWISGAERGKSWFLISLLVCGLVPVNAMSIADMHLANWWPLALLGTILVQDALSRRCTGRLVAGAAPLFAAFAAGTDLTTNRLVEAGIVGHAFLLFALSVCCLRQDRWALILRIGFAVLLPTMLFGGLVAATLNLLPLTGVLAWSIALTLAGLVAWELTKTGVLGHAVVACLMLTLVSGCLRLAEPVSQLDNDVKWMFAAAAFLLAAGFAISSSKAGWQGRIRTSIGRSIRQSVKAIEAATPVVTAGEPHPD